MKTEEASTEAPTYAERVTAARRHRRLMRKAFRGIMTRRTSDSFNPEVRAFHTRSRHIDGMMGRARRREVGPRGGKKTVRLGAKGAA